VSTIDQQFIEYIVKSLVGNPDKVEVKRTIDEKGVLLELTVDPQDLGRVIGKRGSGAQALRTLLRALGTKNDARYNLKIVDNGEPRSERPERKQEEKAEKQPAEEAEAAEQEVEDEVFTDDEESDGDSIADKTRKELADLDDLDI
jgi:hypothetical protein